MTGGALHKRLYNAWKFGLAFLRHWSKINPKELL
jgi:hypothetical protein